MTSPLAIHCPHCQRRLKIENRSLLGRKVKCPGCGEPFVLAEPAATRKDPSPAAPPTKPPAAPVASSPPEASKEPSLDDLAQIAQQHDPLDRIRRKPAKSAGIPPIYLIGGVVAAVLVAGGVAFFVLGKKPAPVAVAPPAQPVPQTTASAATSDQVYSKADLQQDRRLIEEFNPTHGKPVELLLMPSGVNLVIHLRPALLWSDADRYRVLRASLTDDVMNWLQSTLQSHCEINPAEIETVTMGFILGGRGTEPQVCTVIRLPEGTTLAKYEKDFRDISLNPDLHRVQTKGNVGYYVADARTIAIAPKELAVELPDWDRTPNPEVSVGISQLLALTDQDRLLSITGNVSDLQRQATRLLPPAGAETVEQILTWLGDDVEAASWSVHDDPYLHAELRLRPVSLVPLAELRKRMQERLTKLPESMWKDVCLKMQPRESRFRQMIGRFPAMLEATVQSTVFSVQNNALLLTTVLPEKATSNLALAALFTVNEAARTNFSAPVAAAAKTAVPVIPENVADRLQLPVDADFNRMPLEQVLQFLCDEAHVKLHIDGDALKDAGYTRNMPQTFTLGRVPVATALQHIVKTYQEKGKELAISLNEAEKSLTVTTRKFADQKGLPVWSGN